ncbi:hypothetical protein DPX16_23882 [Anabarilius grahami]|uniref:Uncharacterized protein n=1 Tax=Anabarilius grahami TaxID=495550 RepID=A0A3N0YX46_ANAGA|nr:hypothetical protein DPX16_23882 [Anabarilius grahami]
MIKDGFTNHVMKIIVLGSTAGEEDANIADVIIIIEGTEILSGSRPFRTPLDHAPPSRSFSGPPTSSSETNSQALSSNLPAERKKSTNCTSAKLKLDKQHQCK